MEFTMLNNNFTNRMKEENREVIEKNVNEKRLKISHQEKSIKNVRGL